MTDKTILFNKIDFSIIGLILILFQTVNANIIFKVIFQMDTNSIILKLSLLYKVQNIILPLRHEDTKVHKDLISNNLCFVQLSALVPLWQKTFRRRLKFETVIIFV